MTKEEIEQTFDWLENHFCIEGGNQETKQFYKLKDYCQQLQQENESLKAEVELIASNKLISISDKVAKLIDVDKKLEERNKQKTILDVLNPYFTVEDLNGKYWLRVGGNGYDKWFVYEITEEQYKTLKEWKENEKL